jgi:hypothetical protein
VVLFALFAHQTRKSIKRALSLASSPRETPPWLMAAALEMFSARDLPGGRGPWNSCQSSLSKIFLFYGIVDPAMFASSRLD